MTAAEPAPWRGVHERACGEHLTGFGRSWCFDCSEWCYPHAPCTRCELAQLHGENEALKDSLSYAESGLELESARATLNLTDAAAALYELAVSAPTSDEAIGDMRAWLAERGHLMTPPSP